MNKVSEKNKIGSVFMKRFTIISFIVLVVLLIALAIGDWDYTFSSAIINEESIWAEFFNMFGEFPAFFALLVGSTILFSRRNRDVLWRNVLAWVGGILFIGLFSFAITFMPINYAFEHAEEGIPRIWIVIAILMTIGLTIFAVLLAQKHQNTFSSLNKHAWLLIILVIAEVIMVNLLKGIWARPRMRSIEDISAFKHWYEIAGWTNDNEYKSFPSGHTANGFVSIAYLIFLPYFKSIKPRIFITFAITWGVLVALSRVVLGAHFLSDVLVGSYITIFLFLLLNHLLFKKPAEE
jgi:membrane-associated phospholipid phosphatase